MFSKCISILIASETLVEGSNRAKDEQGTAQNQAQDGSNIGIIPIIAAVVITFGIFIAYKLNELEEEAIQPTSSAAPNLTQTGRGIAPQEEQQIDQAATSSLKRKSTENKKNTSDTHKDATTIEGGPNAEKERLQQEEQEEEEERRKREEEQRKREEAEQILNHIYVDSDSQKNKNEIIFINNLEYNISPLYVINNNGIYMLCFCCGMQRLYFIHLNDLRDYVCDTLLIHQHKMPNKYNNPDLRIKQLDNNSDEYNRIMERHNNDSYRKSLQQLIDEQYQSHKERSQIATKEAEAYANTSNQHIDDYFQQHGHFLDGMSEEIIAATKEAEYNLSILDVYLNAYQARFGLLDTEEISLESLYTNLTRGVFKSIYINNIIKKLCENLTKLYSADDEIQKLWILIYFSINPTISISNNVNMVTLKSTLMWCQINKYNTSYNYVHSYYQEHCTQLSNIDTKYQMAIKNVHTYLDKFLCDRYSKDICQKIMLYHRNEALLKLMPEDDKNNIYIQEFMKQLYKNLKILYAAPKDIQDIALIYFGTIKETSCSQPCTINLQLKLKAYENDASIIENSNESKTLNGNL